MGEIIKFRKPSAAERNKGQTLCRHGRHRWKVETENVFDVKQGKLVTKYVCDRCGKHKTKAI
jgi:hypothetical protein